MQILWITLVVLSCSLSSVAAVADTKFYKLLGVDPGADDRTIKKAYKKQAL